jgi:hypothetical protein
MTGKPATECQPGQRRRRPNSAPAYYLGRPAGLWLTVMRARRGPTAGAAGSETGDLRQGPSPWSGRADQACFVGRDDQVRPVARAELHQQPSDVRLRGGHAHVESSGDLGVGKAKPD